MGKHRIRIQTSQDRQLETETLLADIGKLAKIGGWKYDVETQQVQWTSEIFEIYGLTEGADVSDVDVLAFYDMPGRQELEDAFQRCLTSGVPYDLELAFTNSKGQKLWVHTLGRAIQADGKSVELVGTLQDITERKRFQQSLAASEERLRLLSQQVPGLVYEFQMFPDGRLCFPYVSENIRDLFGRSPKEVLSDASAVLENVHPDDHNRVFESIRTSFHTLNIWDCEFRFQHPQKGILWIWGHSKPTAQPDGSVLWHGYLVDISERKAAENEREQLLIRLNQAHKMESVGRLAGGIAHDFNNMLGVILGNVQLVLERLDAEHPMREELADIENAAKSSVDLIRQLLAFARKQTVAPKILDLNETLKGTLKMLRRVIEEQIHFDWRPGSDVGQVYMDPSQLNQIMTNLCVNARDAIAGAGTITIETAHVTYDRPPMLEDSEHTSSDFVMLSVSDDGCGIEADLINHLFEPFFTTKDVGKGSGLGLATVYGAVKQNDGFIEVMGEPNQGTTFKIYLPCYDKKPRSAQQEESSANPLANAETIFLVEDETAILKMTTAMLKRMGYTVIPTSSPSQAIGIAQKHQGHISLLMTDIIMPEMSGQNLAKQLMTNNPDMKCLLMSGYTADTIADHGAIEDDLQFIQKPFTKKELTDKLRTIFDRP